MGVAHFANDITEDPALPARAREAAAELGGRSAKLRVVPQQLHKGHPLRFGAPAAASSSAINSPCSERWLRAARRRSASNRGSGTSLIDRLGMMMTSTAEPIWFHYGTAVESRQ
jgi:hypothetical protein